MDAYMPTIHIDRKQGLIRLYDEGASFEQKSPYRTIISFIMLDPTVIYVYGAKGHISQESIEAFLEILKADSIEHIVFEKGTFVFKGSKFLIGNLKVYAI